MAKSKIMLYTSNHEKVNEFGTVSVKWNLSFKKMNLRLYTLFFVLMLNWQSASALDFNRKDTAWDDKVRMFEPGSFFSVGFSNRLAATSDVYHKIKYYNHSYSADDTFNYGGKLESSSNLVNTVLAFGVNSKYLGAKAEIGFVPFANRNAHQSLSLFGIIPLGDKLVLSPSIGYTRFRKMRRIGSMEGKKGNIIFENEMFNQLSLRAVQVEHSYHYALGLYYKFSETVLFNLEARYHNVFDVRQKLKIRGYKDDANSSFIESLLIPKRCKNYNENSGPVLFTDHKGNQTEKFFDVKNISISAQVVFLINTY